MPRPPYLEHLQHQLRTKRKERYDQVVALHDAGKGVRTIARELGLNRQTIRRFVLAGTFPERAPRRAKQTQSLYPLVGGTLERRRDQRTAVVA
jgi:IS30 family transposase